LNEKKTFSKEEIQKDFVYIYKNISKIEEELSMIEKDPSFITSMLSTSNKL
jgi:hypothetical protein